MIVDFGQYHEGDEVTLYTDDVPLLKFRIHAFKPDQTTLPDKLFDVKALWLIRLCQFAML